MDFLGIGKTIKAFKELLTKIDNKLETMDKRLEKIENAVEPLEDKVVNLGMACGKAFQQTKVVINALKDATENIGESLDEYGGVIEASSFDW
jgi:archaellum component FlaC